MDEDTRELLMAGIVIGGLIIAAFIITKYMSKPTYTEFTRDADGRIISIVEK